MIRMYQKGILYPEGKDLENITNIETKEEKTRCIIVPHMDLRRCYKEIGEAFSILKKAEHYIIFAPLHKRRLLKDDEDYFFEGENLPESNMVSLGLTKREYYAEEEVGSEILLPFIINNYPTSTFSIVYCDVERSSVSKKLSEYISSVDSDEISYVISSNMTGICKDSKIMIEEKEKALCSLTSGNPVWKEKNEKKLNICGIGIIDAFDHVFGRGWNILNKIEEENYTGHAVLYK